MIFVSDTYTSVYASVSTERLHVYTPPSPKGQKVLAIARRCYKNRREESERDEEEKEKKVGEGWGEETGIVNGVGKFTGISAPGEVSHKRGEGDVALQNSRIGEACRFLRTWDICKIFTSFSFYFLYFIFLSFCFHYRHGMAFQSVLPVPGSIRFVCKERTLGEILCRLEIPICFYIFTSGVLHHVLGDWIL